jgi:hypothetical protein
VGPTCRQSLLNPRHPLIQASWCMQVRMCITGEVTDDGGICSDCMGGKQFSFSPKNRVCDSCDIKRSRCHSDRGDVVVPEDGYWQSSPFSPQFHKCPNRDSCLPTALPDNATKTTTNTTSIRVEGLRNYTLKLARGFSLSKEVVDAYQKLQCSGATKAICAATARKCPCLMGTKGMPAPVAHPTEL